MYFKRMELNGFKSFADPVTIEFTDGITCIVGPNGSGKSNISDALRWVLGEQSPKSLRGGKMEDVIFAGTENRKAKGMAEVTLVIDNTERTLPIDFAEVGITRRMYRSGESEYMINRTPCRLRDIRELIMDTGIGVEGYSIIGQGKISDIVSNKMESRREIFEEAAGIVKYRTKKAETEKSLSTAKDHLDRVNDIVYEIESRIGGLEEDSKKASEYLELREKYKAVEINVLLKNIEISDQRAETTKEEIREAEQGLELLVKNRDAAEEKLSLQKEAVLRLEAETASAREALTSKTEEIHRITSTRELNLERLASLEKDDQRLTEELAAIEEKKARQDELLGSLQEELSQAEKDSLELKDLVKELDEKRAAAFDDLEESRDWADDLRNRLLALSSETATLRAEAQSAESLKQSLLRRKTSLQEEDGRLGAAQAVRAQLEEAKKEFEEARSAEEELKQALIQTIDRIEEAEIAEEKASKRAEELRVQSGRLSAREKLLDELEKAYEGYGGGVRFLMSRNVKGIIGVLGELLKVPAGWELAIETVLGAKMQDIVCQSDASAKVAIDLLKKHQAGRLTFLPVDDLRVQRPASAESVKNSKGFLGLASDHVTITSGHHHIVEYMLGKVVICDTLDNALAMSERNDNGLRFVTLEGEIVNAAGAITGGSFKNNTGNILSRKAERDQLSQKLAQNEAELVQVNAAKLKASEMRSQALKDREKAAARVSEKQTERALKESSLGLLELRLKDEEGSEKSRLAELKDLDLEILRTGEDAKSSLAKLDAAQEETAMVKEQLQEAVQTLDLQQKAADESSEAVTQARLKEGAALQSVKSVQSRIADLKNAQTELSSEALAKKESLAKNSLLRTQTLTFGDGAEDAIAALEKEKCFLEERLASLEEERRAQEQQREAFEEDRRRAESAMYDKQMVKHDAELRLARCEAHTDSFKDKLYDEFTLTYAQAYELADPDFVLNKGMRESREYKDRMKAIGSVNIGAIEEYRSVKERYDFLTAQRSDLLEAISQLNTVITDTDQLIKDLFKKSFDSVVENFELTFKELFKGGNARLSLADPDDPMESAIEIEAQPPGKKLQNINLLSGGEKTMTAIALMFAVLRSKPTPFCILDEVEAALDENNIRCFAAYLKKFSRTQFALVTHQKATMEHADVMYGVTMAEHGVSKMLSLKLGDQISL